MPDKTSIGGRTLPVFAAGSLLLSKVRMVAKLRDSARSTKRESQPFSGSSHFDVT
jgi:hypothetical protein